MLQLWAGGVAVWPAAVVHQLHGAVAALVVVAVEHAPGVDTVTHVVISGSGGAVALAPKLAALALPAPRQFLALATQLAPAPALLLACPALLLSLEILAVLAVLLLPAAAVAAADAAALALPVVSAAAAATSMVSADISSFAIAFSAAATDLLLAAAAIEAPDKAAGCAGGFFIVQPAKGKKNVITSAQKNISKFAINS